MIACAGVGHRLAGKFCVLSTHIKDFVFLSIIYSALSRQKYGGGGVKAQPSLWAPRRGELNIGTGVA